MERKISLTPKSLIRHKWIMDSSSFGPLEVPFKLSAEDFLDFAKKDVEENSLHGDVNAITNVKRCIENRLDSLLFLFGYHESAEKEKWAFPKKLKTLEALGIRAPLILHKKINLERVMVEHRYGKPPKHEDISDFIDIAELFLVASNNFINNTVTDFRYYTERKGQIQLCLTMKLEVGKGMMHVEIRIGDKEKKFSLETGDENYPDWITLFNKIGYHLR